MCPGTSRATRTCRDAGEGGSGRGDGDGKFARRSAAATGARAGPRAAVSRESRNRATTDDQLGVAEVHLVRIN